MPNTDPVTDNQAAVGFIVRQSARAGLTRVYPIGAISVGQRGERLSEFGEMVGAGAVAVSDDGKPVVSSHLMRTALEYARTFEIPVADHCEEPTLASGGVMHEGLVSTRLGLKGIPAAAEEIMVGRDILLAQLTGGHVHLCHVSTRGSVELIRRGEGEGGPGHPPGAPPCRPRSPPREGPPPPPRCSACPAVRCSPAQSPMSWCSTRPRAGPWTRPRCFPRAATRRSPAARSPGAPRSRWWAARSCTRWRLPPGGDGARRGATNGPVLPSAGRAGSHRRAGWQPCRPPGPGSRAGDSGGPDQGAARAGGHGRGGPAGP